jgi:hypothetical protein
MAFEPRPAAPDSERAAAAVTMRGAPEPHVPVRDEARPDDGGRSAAPTPAPLAVPADAASPAVAARVDGAVGDDVHRTTCTQAQIRRFIKSRPWIPMHELRRRFGIPGGDDDVTPVRTGSGMIFLGLPAPEARMLGELLNGGDVGYELSLDPGAPVVVGVYPMRPVPRG